MNIQRIDDSSVALEFDVNELRSAGLSPENLSDEQALELLRGTMPDSDTDGAELELFCGRHSLLIFAHLCAGSACFFAFSSLDDLLGAVAAINPSVSSSLFKTGKGYILMLRLPRGAALPSPLYEYGFQLTLHPYAVLHLREQAAELIARGAVSQLKRAFAL